MPREICTPILADKRLLIVAGSIVLVLALVALGRQPSDSVLTWLGGVVVAYIGQSQWGQTSRAKALVPPPPKAQEVRV